MKGLLKLHRNQLGFTLVELLIVIVILGVLAAIALPNFTGLTSQGKTEADSTELKIVQTAMDVMIAQEKVASVTATGPTNDMAAFPSAPAALFPDYMRDRFTSENYTCDSTGNVTQTILP